MISVSKEQARLLRIMCDSHQSFGLNNLAKLKSSGLDFPIEWENETMYEFNQLQDIKKKLEGIDE